MSGIPTWHQRAMAHPDHQSGMISEGMIRARMCEEIEDLRAEIERLRARVRQLEQVREAALNACADWYLSLHVDDRDGMEYVEPNRGLMKSMGKLSEIATEAKP